MCLLILVFRITFPQVWQLAGKIFHQIYGSELVICYTNILLTMQ
jgi:hypothetical protein